MLVENKNKGGNRFDTGTAAGEALRPPFTLRATFVKGLRLAFISTEDTNKIVGSLIQCFPPLSRLTAA